MFGVNDYHKVILIVAKYGNRTSWLKFCKIQKYSYFEPWTSTLLLF